MKPKMNLWKSFFLILPLTVSVACKTSGIPKPIPAPQAEEIPTEILRWPGEIKDTNGSPIETEKGGVYLDKIAHDSLKLKLKWMRGAPKKVYQVQLDGLAEKAEKNRQTSLDIQQQEIELKSVPRWKAILGFGVGFGALGVVVGSVVTSIAIGVK